MVGIVLVSHSKQIAEGTADLVLQMAGEVEISAVGGDADGSFGTDPERIEASIRGLEADEVLVFMDLGSAVLSAETVLEMLPPERRERVTLVDAPLSKGPSRPGSRPRPERTRRSAWRRRWRPARNRSCKKARGQGLTVPGGARVHSLCRSHEILKEVTSMETNRGSEGILSDEMSGKREEIVELLKTAYFMELETSQ